MSSPSYNLLANWYVYRLWFQAFDFCSTTRNEPFLHLFHCLYVYPVAVTLSRKRNPFIRVELRKDDTDIRKQPLEVNILIINQTWIRADLFLESYLFLTNDLARQYIQENLVFHSRNGFIHRSLLVLGPLATMMKLRSLFLPHGRHHIICYSLFFMLISRQSLKLQDQ